MKIIAAINYVVGFFLNAKKTRITYSLNYLNRARNIDRNYLDYIRLATLELVADELNSAKIEGSVAELGVYKGKFARYINQYFSQRTLYLFDTFEGFNKADIDQEKNQRFSTGEQDFSNTSINEVLKRMPFVDKCIVKQGYFPQTSIENSELIAKLLDQRKLPHQVLNAKQHAREAEIIAQAGRPKMITIATNMAGRGTDIVLGGNVGKQSSLLEADDALSNAEKAAKIKQLQDEWQGIHDQVLAAGGLHIIGTERHESRRIDNQLRGRSGRQGDPGSSRFYLSLDDALLRIFAGDRLRAVMDRLKMPDGEPIEAGMVTRSIESAQRKVEGRNFDIRKQLLEYDDVANDQRKETYRLRNEVLESVDIGDLIANLREDVLRSVCLVYVPLESVEEQWDLAGLENALASEWGLTVDLRNWIESAETVEDAEITERVLKAAKDAYDAKVELCGRESFAGFERSVLLYSVDSHWREHLAALDHLRQGIHLRGYAQKDPKQEYRREAFELYGELLNVIKNDVVKNIMTVQIRSASELDQASEAMNEDLAKLSDVQYQHADPEKEVAGSTGDRGAAIDIQPAPIRTGPKVGRNDPCTCGSGKKYKNCCGALS